MKRVRAVLAGTAVILLALGAGVSEARDSWSVSIGVPGLAIGYGHGWHGHGWGYVAASPYYYAPPPAYYYPPPPAYVAPPPVVYAPPPVEYSAPRSCPPGFTLEPAYDRPGWVCARPAY